MGLLHLQIVARQIALSALHLVHREVTTCFLYEYQQTRTIVAFESVDFDARDNVSFFTRGTLSDTLIQSCRSGKVLCCTYALNIERSCKLRSHCYQLRSQNSTAATAN